jgi:hypothetical protein
MSGNAKIGSVSRRGTAQAALAVGGWFVTLVVSAMSIALVVTYLLP